MFAQGPKRVFRNKWFTRFAVKNGLTDEGLSKAIADAGRGLIAADLGGGVIKQRVAREGGGKSGGFRTIILFRARTRAVFVYGFAKSARQNISTEELAVFRSLAAEMDTYDDVALDRAVENGTLVEIVSDG